MAVKVKVIKRDEANDKRISGTVKDKRQLLIDERRRLLQRASEIKRELVATV